MGLDETYRHQIACGAILHDAGKIGVPGGDSGVSG